MTIVDTIHDGYYGSRARLGMGQLEPARRVGARPAHVVAVDRALPRLHEEWRKAQAPIDANIAVARALRPAYRCSVLSNADLSLRSRLEKELELHESVGNISPLRRRSPPSGPPSPVT